MTILVCAKTWKISLDLCICASSYASVYIGDTVHDKGVVIFPVNFAECLS